MSFRSEIFVLIGPPGSGKGSLSSLCEKKLGWVQLSTGNLCRKHIAERTKIGKEIDLILKSGKLISDDLVTKMVSKWFEQQIGRVPAVVLDGYPRTVKQAQLFDDFLSLSFPSLRVKVIRFALSDNTVIDRLCNRAICQNKNCQLVYSLESGSSLAPKKSGICDVCSTQLGRRNDDEKEAVQKRLQVYHRHEQVLLDFYRNSGQSINEVDANKPLVKVFENFMNFCDSTA